MSVTCHVAVQQLWSDGATAVHVNEVVPRVPASVFVCFTGLLVYRWREADITAYKEKCLTAEVCVCVCAHSQL